MSLITRISIFFIVVACLNRGVNSERMKLRFCGDADCPDWVLAEINILSRLSSVKVKLLLQVVVQGILNPPIDMEKAEKLFADSKLDTNIDLKACIACLTYIITSAVKYNCDHNALHSELQQLGLPREHSTSIKRVTDDQCVEIAAKLHADTLTINPLRAISAEVEADSRCTVLKMQIGEEDSTVVMTRFTVDVLLRDLKSIKTTMKELHDSQYVP